MDESAQTLSFCSFCAKIDFRALFRDDPDGPRDGLFLIRSSYELGSINDILQREHECVLCRVLVAGFHKRFGDATPTQSRGMTMICKLKEIAVAAIPIDKRWKALHRLAFVVEAEEDMEVSSDTDSADWPVEVARFQAVAHDLIDEPLNMNITLTSPRAAEYDRGKILTWLRLCEKNHAPTCSSAAADVVPNFRLIDCRAHCIVDRKSLRGEVRYLALSYVWGSGGQKWSLTKKTTNAAHERGFLQTVPLAATIADAMEFTCQLEERFLWVDSICIIQDCEEDKLAQIPLMGSIYRQALVTVAAAFGGDANDGLPGIRPNSRCVQSHVLQTEDLTMAMGLEMDFEELRGNDMQHWPIQKRKWTFQESLLAQKCLVFSNEQIYWRCGQSTWSEEMLLQPGGDSLFSDWIYWPLHSNTIELEAIAGPGSGDFAKTYGQIVRGYSQRNATYAVDALHAFAGIASAITELTNVTFVWGIPEVWFDFYLLWKLYGQGSRWTSSENTTSTSAQFPSWSWLAWHGPVTSPGTTTLAEVTCFFLDCQGPYSDPTTTPMRRVHRDNERMRSRPSGVYRDPLYPERGWKRADDATVTAKDVSSQYPEATFLGQFHLFFWTSSARLLVCYDEDECVVHLPPRPGSSLSSSSSTGAPDMIDAPTSEIVGRQISQWPAISWPKIGSSPSLQEFIVVGSHVDHRPRALEIMMISWEAGIAVREVITLVNEKDWMEADRTWKLIALG